jgi:glycine/serine hydroxymethyltransferase
MFNQLLANVRVDEERVRGSLNLTANENILSNSARHFLASPLGERYYWEGEENGIVALGSFLMPGYPGVREIVEEAERILCRMLAAEHVNCNMLSGVHAMSSTITALSSPGDTVASIPVSHGGHFLTQPIISSIGRKHIPLPFKFDPLRIDLERCSEFLKKEKPKLIYLDTSYALEAHPISQLRELTPPETLIVYDASHSLGLITGGQFQSPLLEGADVITANTHKTFPGPHRGIVAFRDGAYGKAKKDEINNFCSSIHCNQLLALCVTVFEMNQWGEKYAFDTIANARALGNALLSLGFELRKTSTGHTTNNNQLHVYLSCQKNYKERFQHLISNRVSLNFKEMQRPLMRIGTQEVTRRGMKDKEMIEIAQILFDCLQFNDVKERVTDLLNKFQTCKYTLDS